MQLKQSLKICPTPMRKNYSYSRDYILIANFLMMLLLPLVLISVMNTLMFLTIRKSSRRQNVTQVTSRQRRDRKVYCTDLQHKPFYFNIVLIGSHVTAHCGGGLHRVQHDESLHQHLRGNSERNILISIFC